MSRPRKIPELVREEIARVAQMRRALPSDKELARKGQCSVSAVKKLMQRLMRVVSEKELTV